jgi:hypothetical protein
MNNAVKPTINFDEAKKIAGRAAEQFLRPFAPNPSTPVLRDFYLEAENCWMFFRNKAIIFPEHLGFSASFAYVVSKKGTCNYIADFSDEPEKLYAYLQKFVHYHNHYGT